MGTYINIGNAGFRAARNGEYVDKSGLIAVKSNNWTNVIKALKASEQLLRDTLDGDEEAVARGVDAAHDENTSILSYNNENSLACVLSIAYYYARNDYVMHRELPTGKGFADIVLIPRKNVEFVIITYPYDDDRGDCKIRHWKTPKLVK